MRDRVQEQAAREGGAISVTSKTPAEGADAVDQAPRKELSEAAKRALAEAKARRADMDARTAELQAKREINGRGGPDPVRYADWEVKGIASDF
jgi:hypothetical protein